MKLLPIHIIVLIFCTSVANAQFSGSVISKTGDTIYTSTLSEAWVFRFKSEKDYRKYKRLVYNLKKVYPYALAAKRKMAQLDAKYMMLTTDKERKEYAKTIEKELFAEFESPLRKLTISQGSLLIKLIDRETGRTSYNVIKEFKGGFSASLWQGVAKLFGHNLKALYDAEGNDKILEELIAKYEDGSFDNLYYQIFYK